MLSELRLKISGMRCNGGMEAVAKILADQLGVFAVKVSFSSETAVLDVDGLRFDLGAAQASAALGGFAFEPA